ncbi:MAG TPA: FAD-dependent oxidoreductase, partial [Patescibacteria group bacterium]|nr:FAD-dependent oxidoreductase [Patescibacteria group bacterium]
MEKIKILGAGIAGLTAAINLKKEGYNVEVFEKNSDCGQRFHGDMQGIENWSKKIDVIDDLASKNVAINFDCTPFSNLTLSNCKIDEKFNFDRPLFYLVKRGDVAGSLDQGL